MPYGRSILPHIISLDGGSTVVQLVCLAVTMAVVIVVVPLLSTFAVALLNLDGSWDGRHKVSYSLQGIALLFEWALGVSREQLMSAAAVVAGAFLLLAVADLAGLTWPLSWRTDSDSCYSEMFCEPPRPGRLVRHLGNTISNYIYLFTGVVVLLSASQSNFWAADSVFGVCLLWLGCCSIIWHASNAPKSHYVDLWSMDCCIAYLILRNIGMVVLWLIKPYSDIGGGIANGFCLLLYLYAIYMIMLERCGPGLSFCRGKGPLDSRCIWSGRRRLAAGDMNIAGVCVFWGMPALYMIIPALVQCFAIKASGSIVATTIAGLTLAVGWSYRMVERFCLDGCVPMNLVLQLPASSFRTVAAAVVSPTAQLHWLTGFTLLFGYAWVRSIDQEI